MSGTEKTLYISLRCLKTNDKTCTLTSNTVGGPDRMPSRAVVWRPLVYSMNYEFCNILCIDVNKQNLPIRFHSLI